jgi:hypothetical protein
MEGICHRNVDPAPMPALADHPQGHNMTERHDRDDARDEAIHALPLGARVEVRTRYRRSWSNGFEIAGTTSDGYWLRRDSDRSVLPCAFVAGDVRRSERRSTLESYC